MDTARVVLLVLVVGVLYVIISSAANAITNPIRNLANEFVTPLSPSETGPRVTALLQRARRGPAPPRADDL